MIGGHRPPLQKDVIVCEGDRIFYEDHPGVIYRVLSLGPINRYGNIEIVESKEPEEYPVGMVQEGADLLSARFIGEFIEEG